MYKFSVPFPVLILCVFASRGLLADGCEANCCFQYNLCRIHGLSGNRCQATYDYCVENCHNPASSVSTQACASIPEAPGLDDMQRIFSRAGKINEAEIKIGATWDCTTVSRSYRGGQGYYAPLYHTWYSPRWISQMTCPVSLSIVRKDNRLLLNVTGDSAYTHADPYHRQALVFDLDPVSNFDLGVNQVPFSIQSGSPWTAGSASFQNSAVPGSITSTNVELRYTARGALVLHYQARVSTSAESYAEGYAICQ